MSDCLTGDEVRGVVEGHAPARGYDAVDQHLLSYEACRAAVRRGFEDVSRTEASDGGHVEELGRGGFGKVVLARDATLGRDVAMKRLTSERLANARATTRAACSSAPRCASCTRRSTCCSPAA